MLHPDHVKPGADPEVYLVREAELSKWGNDVAGYLAAFDRARKAMAAEKRGDSGER